jgi:TonB family protein
MAAFLFALAVTVAQAQAPGAPAADLSTAKTLYTSAAYEEALTHLSSIKDPALAEQVQQYRALCLLALGRADEARQALELIVVTRPFYRMNEADVSPRLISMFQDVRRRLLPAAARNLYERAKASYDAEQFADAQRDFKDLMVLMKDADLASHAAELADMKMLAEGFLTLTAAALAPKPAPPPPPPPAPVTPPTPVKPTGPVIYSVEDTDVVPPGDVERRLPPWDATNRALAATARRGVLEVIINERGLVESAILRAPVSPLYDNQLLEAARKWKFTPATKNGKPVKFRRLFAISLTGE